MAEGILYLCATPIGNLEDITLRAIRVLKEVDYIGAEDTRWSRKLLDHYGIKKQPFSCFVHNELQRADWILERLQEGESIALITSAGMPGVSDPGNILVERVLQAGLAVEVIPGPSAVTAALALSGWGGGEFHFAGFLARQGKKREEILNFLTGLTCPAVIFESPHRIMATLEEIQEIMGSGRQVFLAREITKIHQETLLGEVGEIISRLKDREKIKGEITLVIRGGEKKEKPHPDEAVSFDKEKLLEKLLQAGVSRKDAVKILQEVLSLPRNKIYEFVHKKK